MVVCMTKQTITLFQVSMILIGSIGIINHVIMIPMLLDTSGRDSWISIILVSIIYLIWISLIFIIYRNIKNEHLFSWLKNNFGKLSVYPIIFIVVIYLITIGVVALKETLTFFSFYLPETPHFVLGILFSMICLYNATRGIQSIALTTGVLLPIVFLLGFFVMFANVPHKDYSLLQPMMENGMKPVFRGMVYPAAGFLELIFILFLQHHICSKVKLYQLIALGMVIIGITIGPVMAAIIEFGPFVAANQRYPAFEEWRLVSIGRYIENLDFLSVYQWLVGIFIRLSLVVFLIPDLLSITNRKTRNGVMFAILSCILLISILPICDSSFYWFVSQIILPVSALGLFLFSILLIVFVWVAKFKKSS